MRHKSNHRATPPSYHEIRFTTIPELAPGLQREYVIPVTPNRTGRVQVRAQIAATNPASAKTIDSEVIEIVSGSQ
jgi:hypothetical protein